jgi:hypothetical protein
MLMQNPELLNNPRVRARVENYLENLDVNQHPFVRRLQQPPPQQQDNTESSSSEQTAFNYDTNLPAIEHLVIFPPLPFASPITSVTTPGFRIFSFAGTVSNLMRISDPTEWLSARTTADKSLLDDILLNFIHFTHADCPAPESHKAAALMYIMLYKPGGIEPLGSGEGWHRDPPPWPLDGHIPTRYAVTLLGDATRMLDPALGPSPALGRVMPQLFAGEHPLQSGQIVRFSMGRIESPVHAVPPITKDRVFVNIVYGSEAEVRANRKRIPWKG